MFIIFAVSNFDKESEWGRVAKLTDLWCIFPEIIIISLYIDQFRYISHDNKLPHTISWWISKNIPGMYITVCIKFHYPLPHTLGRIKRQDNQNQSSIRYNYPLFSLLYFTVYTTIIHFNHIRFVSANMPQITTFTLPMPLENFNFISFF